jgi:lysophospholipase L1-like esterase
MATFHGLSFGKIWHPCTVVPGPATPPGTPPTAPPSPSVPPDPEPDADPDEPPLLAVPPEPLPPPSPTDCPAVVFDVDEPHAITTAHMEMKSQRDDRIAASLILKRTRRARPSSQYAGRRGCRKSRVHAARRASNRPSLQRVSPAMKALFAACGVSLQVVACTSSARLSDAAPSTTPSEAPLAEVRYLALGDSFTIGTGSTPDQAFPARLVARCPRPATLRNLAVNGYSTQDILDREMPEVPAFAPAFVTLAAGANDIVRGSSPDAYRARVHTLLAGLRSAGVVRIVTLPQPDWSRSPAALAFGDPAAIHARIVDANAILRDETVAAGGSYVDLFPLMESQAKIGMIAKDGLHPSADAYDAWAAELARRGMTPCV